MSLDIIYKNYIKKIEEYKNKLLSYKNLNLNFNMIIKQKHEIDNSFGYKIALLKINNETEVNSLINKEFKNKQIYEIFMKYYSNEYNIEKTKLDNQDIFYIELIYKIYQNNGLYLDNIKYNIFNDILDEIDILTKKIITNISKYRSGNHNNYNHILFLSNDRDKRQKYIKKHSYECIENKEQIHNLLKIKNKKANMLGYNSFAEYIIKDNMAKTIENVKKFLDNVKDSLLPILHKDLSLIKKEALLDNITTINEGDIFYYINKLVSKSIENINLNFKLNKVLSGTFKLYKRMLNYEFIELVFEKLYKVVYNNNIIGYLLLDLYKNIHKYTSAEVEIIINKTDKLIPIGAIKCNFDKNITFDELVIFFHEFGHFIQLISSDAKYNYSSPYNTDFIEVPSQLFEELCYNKEVLQYMTDDIITSNYILLLNIKKYKFNSIEIANQLVKSYVDLIMHSTYKVDVDIDILYNDIYKQIFGFDNILNPIYILDNIYEGYDSRYYSYLWSDIYSKDIFLTKFKNNELNENIYLEYKNIFLSKIDYTDQSILFKEYIKRDVNYEEYFKSIYSN